MQKEQERKDLEEKKKVIEETVLSQRKKLNEKLNRYKDKLAFARECFNKLTKNNEGYWELKVFDIIVEEDAYYHQRWGKDYDLCQQIVDKYKELNKDNRHYTFYKSEEWHKGYYNAKEDYKDYIHPTKKEWKHYKKFQYGLRIDLPTLKETTTDCSIEWKEKMQFDYYCYSDGRVEGEKQSAKAPVSIGINKYSPQSGYGYSSKWGLLPELCYGLPQKSQDSYYRDIDVFTYSRYYINLNTITKRVLGQIDYYNECVKRYLDKKKVENYTKTTLEKLHPNAERVSENGRVYLTNGVCLKYGTLSKGEKPKITHTGQIIFPNVEDKKVVAELMEFVMNLKIKK